MEDITIHLITENKKDFLPLLLLGDEQESHIDKYLERGDMFALSMLSRGASLQKDESMNTIQIIMLTELCAFYITYLGKMLLLKRQGIRGNIMGKGDKPKAALLVELFLRTSTFLGALIQFGSVLFPALVFSISVGAAAKWIGITLTLLGCAFFAMSIVIMKNNWRAGFNSEQKTKLVTGGIYRFSRNPAFVGFDLLYIGCALAFPTIINILAAILSLILFHMQIKGEETYLHGMFGQQYADYAAQVPRYLGRRKISS